VIQFHFDRAAHVVDRQLGVQPAVLNAEVVQKAKRLAGEVPQFRMMALGLQLGDDDDRQDHEVLIEPAEGGRVGEQDAGVEHVGSDLAAGPPSGRAGTSPGLGARRGDWLAAGLPRTAANRGTGHAISPGCPERHPARSLCPERLALLGPVR